MLIVSGWIRVDPSARDEYLMDSMEVVECARDAPGCVDFALSADILDPDRINIYERWESEAQLLQFRGNGPTPKQSAQILQAEVARHVISGTGPA